MMFLRYFILSERICGHRHFSSIKIPNRIERGPTDILEALASTVRKDYKAPHYKYHDDPFLIPKNFLDQRSFALSKESGRKAARYFFEKYPQFFYRDDAEPKVAAFSYKDTYNPDLDYNEFDLMNCIQSYQVLNAIELYTDLTSKNVTVSQEAKQSLLELICFYNCNEKADPEYLDGAWFGRDEPENMQRKIWNDGSLADKLFNEIENKTESSYSAIICGLAKFNAGTRAYHMFQEAKEKGFQLDTNTYNHVIKIVPFVRESSETRWELAHQLMKEMNTIGLIPSVNTFTELLQVIYRNVNWSPGIAISLKLMSEMKKLRIEPSLATWYYLSLIHHRTGSQVSSSYILPSIINEVNRQSKSLKLTHMKDFEFFPSAMKTCYFMYNDIELGYQIHSTLTRGGNYKFIGNGFGEQTYYQNFFLLIAENETFKNVLKWYEELVPNIYAPSPTVLAAIINSIAADRAWDHLPKFWNDIVDMQMVKDKTIRAYVSALSEVKPGGNQELNDAIVKVTQDVFKWIKSAADDSLNRPDFVTPTELWSGDILSQLLLVLIKFDQYEIAMNILETISKHGSELSAEISPKVFESMCLKAIEEKNLTTCTFLIKYASNFGQSLNSFIQKHIDTLDEPSRLSLKDFVSDRPLQNM